MTKDAAGIARRTATIRSPTTRSVRALCATGVTGRRDCFTAWVRWVGGPAHRGRQVMLNRESSDYGVGVLEQRNPLRLLRPDGVPEMRSAVVKNGA